MYHFLYTSQLLYVPNIEIYMTEKQQYPIVKKLLFFS